MALDFASLLAQGNTASMAGMGSKVGSMFGPLGSGIGLAAGAVGGLAMDFFGAKKMEEEQDKARLLSTAKDLNAQANIRPQLRFGGPKQLVHFDGKTHEFGGIKLSKAEVEDGETGYGNYVFSNAIGPSGSKKSFADMTKDLERRYFRLNDPISQRAMDMELRRIVDAQEDVRGKMGDNGIVPKEYLRMGGVKQESGKYAMGGFVDAVPPTDNTLDIRVSDQAIAWAPPPQEQAAHLPASFFSEVPSLAGSRTRQIPEGTPDPQWDLPDLTGALVSRKQGIDWEGLASSAGDIAKSGAGLLGRGFGMLKNGTKDIRGGLAGSGQALLPGLTAAVTNRLLMDRVNYPRTTAQTVNAQLLDPTRALQQVGTSFSGQEQNIAGLSGGTGINSRLALAALEADKRSGVATDFEARNRAILASTDQFNAGQRTQADTLNLQQMQREIQDRNTAFAGVGMGVSSALKNYIEEGSKQRVEKEMLSKIGTGNYGFGYDEKGNLVLRAQSGLGGGLAVSPVNATFGEGSVYGAVQTPFTEMASQAAMKNYLNLSAHKKGTK